MKKLQYVENNLKLELIQGIDLDNLKMEITDLYVFFIEDLLSNEINWLQRNCLSYEAIKEKDLKEKSEICLEEIFDDLEIIEMTKGLENFHNEYKNMYSYMEVIKEYKEHISDLEKIEFIKSYVKEIDIITFNEILKEIVFNRLEANAGDRIVILDTIFSHVNK